MANGLAKLTEAKNHAVWGHPRWMGHTGGFWRSTGGGSGKPLHYSCHDNPMNSTKRQKDMTPEDEPPGSEGVSYATEDERRAITNSYRKNEVTRAKHKQLSVVDVPGGKGKVQCG